MNGTIVAIALATHRLSLRAADASTSVAAAFAACWLAASARDALCALALSLYTWRRLKLGGADAQRRLSRGWRTRRSK